MGFFKGLLVGIGSTIGISALTIAIACAINGVTFFQQIVNWFTPLI